MQLDSVGGEGSPKYQYPPEHFYHQISLSRPNTPRHSLIKCQLQRPNDRRVVLVFNQLGIPQIRRTLHTKKCAIDFLLNLLFVLILFQSLLSTAARKYVHPGACSKSRAVFSAPWGIIEDGPAQYNYTKNTHCEWLVNGTASNFISLKFQTMSTECSYDYVFVHDGQTFDSPLLGSFSGKTLPQSVVASSGYLLVILYSDTNYVLEGFRAEYSLTDCPHNCTDKGECVKGVCRCNEKYSGGDCSLALCPDECGKSASRGKCVSVNGLYKCLCNSGFVGDDCSLDLQNYVGNTWSSVSRQGPGRLSPRTSHSSAYDPAHDRLYVYGGFDLNSVSDQFKAYDFQDNTWSVLSPGQDYDSRRWSLNKDSRNSLYPERQPVFQTTSSGVENNSVEIKASKERQIKFAKTKNSTVAVKFLPPVPRRGDTGLESGDISESEDYETTDYNTLLRHRRTPMMQEKLLLPELNELDRSFLNQPQRPPALRGHKMIIIAGGILLYGGKLADGTVTNSLWLYNITSGVWSLKAGDSTVRPTPVWQHTVNLAGDHVYVFGGSTVSGRFVSDIFRISAYGLREWEVVKVIGGKALDVRVTGHTTIYHQKSHSLFVYGGILTDVARFSKLSDRFFNFNLDAQTWTEVHYPKTNQRPGSSVPREMAFHTASVVGNYMVIFGGYSHRHNQDEVCYSSSLYLYHLDCQIWVHHEAMEHTPPGTQYPKTQGVFGHSTEVRNGSELIVIGGYHGTVTGDILGYKLPSTIATENTPCELYGSYTSCTANPKCGWCGSSGKCHQSTETYKCHVSNLQMSSCPGICPALSTCYSCTTHGRTGCEWCVHTGKCHDKGNVYGCPKEAYGKPLPWWGEPVKITTPDACRNHDFRPGLTLTKYRYPPNFDLPDSVEIVNSSKVIFTHPSPLQEREMKMGGEFTVRLSGIIRPRPDRNKPVEQLEVCIGFATAFLSMTSTPPEGFLKSILNISHPVPATSTTSKYPACYQAKWPTGKTIYLYPGTAYPFKFLAYRNASNMVYHHIQNSVILLRNSSQAKQSRTDKEYTVDSLEPYKNGSCHTQSNCQNCLVDSLCGWCSSTFMCLLRQDATCPIRLTIVPEQCVNCSDHIYCSSCVDDSSCEWIVDEARCARHSRFPGALSNPSSCPTSCHERSNCTSCLGSGRCVWCDSTKECFLFSVYTSEFQYGGCRQWFDKPHSDSVDSLDGGLAQCKLCDVHQNCSTCLQDLGCGWCYSDENPTIGACVLGDFNAPSGGMCPVLYNSSNAVVSDSSVKWAYDSCPDINECILNVHECHENATCENVYGSYKCNCNRGFKGDGFSFCNRTCYEHCVHGWCSGHPGYQCKCELGWTGKDCNTNCGCNNHSTCNTGVGVCDKCVEHTMGEFCQLCQIGTFGNATTATGCQPCQCNEHEDVAKGICEEESGICYCTDNTEGNQCQKCKSGFFGNSLEGGQCHYNCGSRVLISGVNQGSFGVHREDSDQNLLRECLWIVAIAEGLSFNSNDLCRPPTGKGTGLVQLTFENSMNVTCPDNYVYVYDGLPPIVSNKMASNLLGSFCTQELIQEKLELESESGFLSVLYTEDNASSGFNASFNLVTCPHHCSGNSSCVGGSCVCQEGWTGIHCTTPICPNNCEAQLLQGFCNKVRGLCICEEGFGGQDCGTRLKPSDIVYTDLFRLEKVGNSNKNSHLPRLGHSMVSDTNGIIWMFGGLSQSRGPLNDVRAFDTRNNSWKLLAVNTKETGNGAGDSVYPAGRYFHAATFSPFTKHMYVHGGMDLHTHFADFWMLDVVKQRWTPLDTYHEKTADTLDTSEGLLRKREPRAKLSDQTPKLAGHTMTLNSDSETLIIIGGFSPDGGFNQHVLEYDLKSSSWQRLEVGGFGPVGIYGHSSVYHAATQTFYVFGGLVFDVDKTKVSSRLWSFNYRKKRWSVLPFETATSQIVPAYLQTSHNLEGRMLHTAIATENYMLIMGGRTMPEKRRGTSYALYELAAYVFDCNQWLNNPLILMWNYKATRVRYVGKPIPPGYGLASARTKSGDIYLMGGISVMLRGNLKKLSLPADLCNLFGENRHVCRNTPGCDYCSIHKSDGGNSTFCYTSSGRKPDGCRAGESVPEITPGIECVRKWENQENKRKRSICDGYKSCSDCLAEWPNRENSSVGPPCQWCSGCARGKCVPKGRDCRREHPCHLRQEDIHDSGRCPELECSAADCDKCVDWPGAKCAWTRQVERSSEMRKEISHWTDLHNWNCVKQSRSLMAVLGSGNSSAIASPPMPCPPRCNVYKNCADCLAATGAEGGHQTCHWSTRINKCISPAYKPLKCVGGICGKVLTSWKDVCPLSCSNYTECRVCLQQVGCGWCSVDSHPTTGLGLCTDGTLDGPKGGECSALKYSIITERNGKPESAVEYYPPVGKEPGTRAKKQGSMSSLTFVTSWHYAKCPPENECVNNHHTCHLTSERCVDREEGFQCKCNVGYQSQNGACIPVCKDGCRNGTCVAPNKCKCQFGYVGVKCDSRCKCNGHSQCPGPEDLDACTKCENNTMGHQCERCTPGYVGDPGNGGKCISCTDYCSGHSSHCYSKDLLISLQNSTTWSIKVPNEEDEVYIRFENSTLGFLEHLTKEGPRKEAICLNCFHDTMGPRCHQCVTGHFRGSTNLAAECKQCHCNMHGSICDPITGGDCQCTNHTETEPNVCSVKRSGSARPSEDCWKNQCTKCKEYFVGDPTEGHQCYRTMSVDQENCFDPSSQRDCNGKPGPLKPGHTIFFAVQPKFMNVDIRVLVDVTQGAVDVLISSESQMFIVETNKSTYYHEIKFDPAFPLNLNLEDFESKEESPVFVVHGKERREDNLMFTLYGKERWGLWPGVKKLMKLDGDSNGIRRNLPQLAANITPTSSRNTFDVREVEADGLVTFISMEKPNEVLYIKNLRHRLVVSLPETSHDLRSSKFYIVVHGSKSQQADMTFGSIFFRQDQLHIDLFVFFSVFFSCFFLFLAACVLFWKMKQVSDLRRARTRHALEMTVMARRPFATINVIISEEPSFIQNFGSSPLSRKRAKNRLSAMCTVHQHNTVRDVLPTKRLLEPEPKHYVRAVAVEPLSDGIAAVTTVLVQQPGAAFCGSSSLSLGSALVNTLRVFPNNKILKRPISNAESR